MNALRALLFDKDGTLVDFDRTWGPAAGAVMARMAGDDVEAQARLHAVSHFLPDEDRFLTTSPLLAGSAQQYGHGWAQALGRPADGALFAEIDRLFAQEARRTVTAIGTPQRTLASLAQAGYVLGVATNDGEQSARIQMELLGLSDLLAAIYGHDSGHGPKPGPGMVEAFCRHAGFAPHEVALIGDTRHDVLAAKAAGAVAVLVRTGPASVDPFAQEADLVLDDLDALAALLLRSEEAA